MNNCHWVHIPEPTDWRCPKCNQIQVYGSKRSLWSLIPFVCIHRPLRWDDQIDQLADQMRFAYLDVGRTIPAREPNKTKDKLRKRLKDELHGNRHYWWAPFTKNYKEILNG